MKFAGVFLSFATLWSRSALAADSQSLVANTSAQLGLDRSAASSPNLWVPEAYDSVQTSANGVEVKTTTAIVNAVLREPAFLTTEAERGRDGAVYWEFGLQKDANSPSTGLFIGLTHADVIDAVPKGYHLEMLAYGGPGNLANGAGLLKAQWGPHIGRYSTVGVLTEYTAVDRQIKVYFYGDHQPLGLAYDVPADTFPSGMRVAIHAVGPLAVTYMPGVDMPDKRERELEFDGVEGVYKLVSPPPRAVPSPSPNAIEPDASRLYTDAELDTMRKKVTLTLRHRYDSPALFFGLKIGNSFSGVLQQQNLGDSWKVPHRLMATKMMPPPMLAEAESSFTAFIARGVHLRAHGENELLMEDDEGNSAVFERLPPAQPPVVTDPQFSSKPSFAAN